MSRDEEARSTERPPAATDDDPHRDIAAAIQRAKSHNSAGRPAAPPAATAKIDKFDLAQALALTTAEGEQIPSSSKPPREDDAPFVAGEVEVVGEEEVNSGIPTVPPKSAAAKSKPPVEAAVVPKQASGNIVLVVLGVLIGLVVMGYVYVTTR